METQHTYLVFQATCQRSYPTYEEWKQPYLFKSFKLLIRSYPTYEEWKLCSCPKIVVLPFSVLILPMRNGNIFFSQASASLNVSSYPTYEEWKLFCNCINFHDFIKFLSYL